MYNLKEKIKNSKFTKVTLGVVLSAVMTTSVFAATGVFNSKEISQEELNSHIQETVNKQLQEKIAALLSQSQKDELSQTVASKINTEEVLARLRKEVEAKLAEATKDMKINQAELDKLISDTIDSVLNSIIDETIAGAIDGALANIDLGNISLDEAIKTEVTSSVESQIRKIIYDNIEQITSDSLDKIIADKQKPTEPDTPTEEGLNLSNIKSGTCNVIESDSYIQSCTYKDKKYLVIDPSESYTGKSMEEFLIDSSTIVNLQSHDSDYGLYIDNINNMLDSTKHYMTKKDDSVYKAMAYISFYEDSNNDSIAVCSNYGVRDTSITPDGVYVFTADMYNSFADSDKIATIKTYTPEQLPYQVNLWGKGQSNHHHSWTLDITNLYEDDLKVEDVLNTLGFEIEVSNTGYVAFKYNGNRISQSNKINGRIPFVPTFYSLTFTDGTPKLGYAKGVNPVKSSIELVSPNTTKQYYMANEWDMKTSPDDVTFE